MSNSENQVKEGSKRFLTYGSVEGEGVLNEMIRNRQFSDVVLGSWAFVDLQVNALVQLTYGLQGNDVRVGYLHLRAIQFEDKLQFIRKVKMITKDEYQEIKKFQDDRNSLLHTKKGKVAWFFKLTEKEKDEIISHAWNAVNNSGLALIRATEKAKAGIFQDFGRKEVQ